MSTAFIPAARHGLSSFVALVDLQPDVGVADQRRRQLTASQCSSCSLVDFLRAAPQTHPALASVVGFFDRLPVIEKSRAAGSTRTLLSIGDAIGVRRVFAIDDGDVSPRWVDLPRIHLVGAAPSERLRGAEWALVGPDRVGPRKLHAGITEAVRAGVTRILVGYHRHASAMDYWSDFAGAPDFGETWRDCIEGAWAAGVTELVLLMPYPACALLQWPQYRPLEALRARLDQQLRRAGNESSLMCPENVSGYALFNDTRSARPTTAPSFREVFGIRFEDLVLLL